VGKEYAPDGWTPGIRVWETRPVSTPVERARSLWDALEEDGIERLRPLVADDVEWRPWGHHGRPLIGLEQIAEWHRAQHATGGGSRRVVHQWEGHGECALAFGSLRVFRTGGFLDVQPTWAFFFRDERLQRATCYATREEALAAVAEHVAV
jgi:SnoaL-like domain